MKAIIISDEDWAQLEKWAEDKGKGGWQNLCARIVESHQDEEMALRLRGLDLAIETLKDLREAEAQEGEGGRLPFWRST